MNSASRSSPREGQTNDTGCGGTITGEEWQGWGCVSPVPSMVNEVIQDLKLLENNIDAHMVFGGNGGKLQVHHSKIFIFLALIIHIFYFSFGIYFDFLSWISKGNFFLLPFHF